MDSFIGTVLAVAFNFQPEGWFACNGQILSIQQYTVMYSLMGNTFGGDGTTTFALPDLRGRTVIGNGGGNGQPAYNFGQQGGSASTALTLANLPTHTHSVPAPTIYASKNEGTQATPGVNGAATLGGVNAIDKSTPLLYVDDATPSVALVTGGAAASTGAAGSSVPVSTMPPYLALNYIICMQGLYPPRS